MSDLWIRDQIRKEVAPMKKALAALIRQFYHEKDRKEILEELER